MRAHWVMWSSSRRERVTMCCRLKWNVSIPSRTCPISVRLVLSTSVHLFVSFEWQHWSVWNEVDWRCSRNTLPLWVIAHVWSRDLWRVVYGYVCLYVSLSYTLRLRFFVLCLLKSKSSFNESTWLGPGKPQARIVSILNYGCPRRDGKTETAGSRAHIASWLTFMMSQTGNVECARTLR